MKNILITLLVFITMSCKAQTIINIKDNNGTTVNGAYYKDVDNILNQFEGTWIFTEGNKTLKLVLAKRVGHSNGSTTSDYLRGGYEYTVNNQILANTLIDATVNYTGKLKYSIMGNTVLKNIDIPLCPDCTLGENRLRITFSDPLDRVGGAIGKLIIRKIIINGQEALSVFLWASTSYYQDGNTPPQDDFIVPSGDYILLKQ